jgi:AraC-like DNA-binding protein
MVYDIIILLASFFGYILILLTLKNSKYNRILNSFLLFIFFISSTLLMLAGISDIYNIDELKFYYHECNNYTPLFIPSFYLYFNYLSRERQRFLIKDFMHVLFLLLAILEREFLVLDKLLGYKLNYFFSQFFAIYAVVYVVKIYLLLKNNVWNRKAILNIVNTQNKLIKKWTIILFICLIFFTSRFYFVYYKHYLFSEALIEDHAFKQLWITALAWIVLFVIILSHPEILFGYYKFQVKPSKIKPNSYNKNYWNKISKIKINNNQEQKLKEKISSKIEKYIYELDTILYNNSYFINPNFSIQDLAHVLNIPKSHLVFVFKYHSELSFSDYKKISRIQNSIELINNNYLNSNTLDSLAKKVGFSSYNPFFTCFKDVVGISPHEYVSTIKIA